MSYRKIQDGNAVNGTIWADIGGDGSTCMGDHGTVCAYMGMNIRPYIEVQQNVVWNLMRYYDRYKIEYVTLLHLKECEVLLY